MEEDSPSISWFHFVDILKAVTGPGQAWTPTNETNKNEETYCFSVAILKPNQKNHRNQKQPPPRHLLKMTVQYRVLSGILLQPQAVGTVLVSGSFFPRDSQASSEQVQYGQEYHFNVEIIW